MTPAAAPLALHALILESMFSPVPRALSSARTAAVLRFRTAATLPPLVSAPHLRALLLATPGAAAASPAAAERAVAARVRAGELRRLVVPTRGSAGELLVRADVLEGMVRGCEGLGEAVRELWVAWLRSHPERLRFEVGEAGWEGLGWREVDALVREGFLTAVNEDGGGGGAGGRGHVRPEERSTMVSLETVARAPAGSVAAVGGAGAVHAVGGTGARSMDRAGAGASSGGGFSVAVPGTGVFLRLASAALEHLAELLQKTQYREMPESDLREKWDGGVVGDSEVAQAKKARGEFTGAVPGRTKKWKEFQGLAFDWVLREAVGAGLVEIFETGCVGRGVRLI
ncbi:e7cef8d3-c954-4c2c-a044-3bde32aa92fa [Thermothielavioides terrestris]|uniref:E7cef8d3-c954-4c2c-a044-3bde32aa92fa n=1 Tax=Thermothielavioides terrestris TaxID=2587410 RepID=A0A446B6D7_9PEZI|nr:e7cef8d3-c954-4c2c-a044-3bde32aa92fa [Thermothielavioides terrestris]